MALSETERLTRSVNTLTDQLVELSERNATLEKAEPHIRFLLDAMDEHMEGVRSNEKIATERELDRLRAYTKLREIYPKGEEQCQE